MKKTIKKLALRSTTLRALERHELTVAGAMVAITVSVTGRPVCGTCSDDSDCFCSPLMG